MIDVIQNGQPVPAFLAKKLRNLSSPDMRTMLGFRGDLYVSEIAVSFVPNSDMIIHGWAIFNKIDKLFMKGIAPLVKSRVVLPRLSVYVRRTERRKGYATALLNELFIHSEFIPHMSPGSSIIVNSYNNEGVRNFWLSLNSPLIRIN